MAKHYGGSYEHFHSSKLETFSELLQDMFHSLYSIQVNFCDELEISTIARKFNKTILQKVIDSDEYGALKQLTEGRELESFTAISDFSEKLLSSLDDLVDAISGKKGTLNVLSNIERKCDELRDDLIQMKQQADYLKASGKDSLLLDNKMVDIANKLKSKAQQAEKLNSIIDTKLAVHKGDISAIVSDALKSAVTSAQEVSDMADAWGIGQNKSGTLDTKAVRSLTDCVKKSTKLSGITKLLGRYKRVLDRQMKGSSFLGRGEKYDIEMGNDISRLVSSEFSLLSSPHTAALFIRKFQKKVLKQYRKREPEVKGKGDIIVCLDESGSTKGGKEYWGKAIALTLLDIAMKRNRFFALIHFSTCSNTEIFKPGMFSTQNILDSAELFLDGGTNFEIPLEEALQLVSKEATGFRKADIVFITDGECDVSKPYLKYFNKSKDQFKFRTTGILLDKGEGLCKSVTLKAFCDRVYRTSEIDEDSIANSLIASLV